MEGLLGTRSDLYEALLGDILIGIFVVPQECVDSHISSAIYEVFDMKLKGDFCTGAHFPSPVWWGVWWGASSIFG